MNYFDSQNVSAEKKLNRIRDCTNTAASNGGKKSHPVVKMALFHVNSSR